MADFSQSQPQTQSQPIRQFFRELVPATDTLLWYFGGLVLFFFGVMLLSGLLMLFHYQPSATAATAPDGTPLLLARITDTTTWLGVEYLPGQLVPVRADSSGGNADFPTPLRSAAEVVRDSATGRPVHPSAAWVSIEHVVMRQTEFGSLVRSVHAWGAQLLVASLLIWFGGLAWQGAWRKPNSAVWSSGLLLILLVLASAWTGSVLPWDRLGYAAAWVGSSLPEQGIPVVGEPLAQAMRGGKEVGGGALTRMAAAHTALLPIALVLVLIFHASWWRRGVVSGNRGYDPSKPFSAAAVLAAGCGLLLVIYPFIASPFNPASPFFLLPLLLLPVCAAQLLNRLAGGAAVSVTSSQASSDGLYRQLVCWLLVAGALLTLAIAAPWTRGEGGFPIDLTQSQLAATQLRPEWYLLGFYQLLEWCSASVAMAFLLSVLLFLSLLPLADRPASAAKGRGAIRWMVYALFLLFLFLTLWGYVEAGG